MKSSEPHEGKVRHQCQVCVARGRWDMAVRFAREVGNGYLLHMHGFGDQPDWGTKGMKKRQTETYRKARIQMA